MYLIDDFLPGLAFRCTQENLGPLSLPRHPLRRLTRYRRRRTREYGEESPDGTVSSTTSVCVYWDRRRDRRRLSWSSPMDWGFPFVLRPGALHDLDYNTPGYLVVFRGPSTFNNLSSLFPERLVGQTSLLLHRSSRVSWGLPSLRRTTEDEDGSRRHEGFYTKGLQGTRNFIYDEGY